MHQTMKKVFAIVLMLCLLVGIVPMGASAAMLEASDYITQSMTLGSDLVLHLYANVPADYTDGATATLTYADQSQTFNVTDLPTAANGNRHMQIEMAVAQMTENINLTVNNGAAELINANYSIRDYLAAIINGNEPQDTKDLCLELLNFGAKAQTYFNHNTDNLADAGYTITPANAIPAQATEVAVDGSVSGISFYGASVRFLSKAAVRFYFKANAVDGYTFTVDGTEYEPVAKDGMYYIETPGINPQDMSKAITVSVTDGSNTLSAEYAPIWYFVRSYNKTDDEATKGLMAAAYSYYKEAENYTAEPPVVEYDTTLCLDMQFDTLGDNWTDDVEIRFYNYGFEGNPHNEYTDSVIFKAGQKQTVKLDAEKYFVDGKLTGIGIGIFGGPAWDAKLPDGYTPDRHTITISDIHMEGEQSGEYDLSKSTMTSGTVDTGYTTANGSGVAAFVDGALVISNGFCYDCHKISLVEDSNTYITFDMQFDTISGNWTNDVNIRFYSYDFAGNPHEKYTDVRTVKAGEKTAIKLNAENYLVNGEVTGIGIGIFGGPEWNTQISDGVYDRHTITISNAKLEGGQSKAFDLSKSTVKSGTNDTGYTTANGSGVASVVNGSLVISNGFCYDCHKISLIEDTNTYVTFDMQIDTLGGNWENDVEIRFYNYDFQGNPHVVYTDCIIFKVGEQQAVKLNAEKYLVDGKLTGIGIGIFGGPAWDAKLPDGYTPDRHTVTISNVKLDSKEFDLSQSIVKSGKNDTGYTEANGSGAASFVNGSLVISNGFCYDCHKISLVEDTNTYITMDLKLETLGGNWPSDVEIRFCNNSQEDSVHEVYTDSILVTPGKKVTVRLNAEKYLVNGELVGFSIAIFGGPAWDAKLEDGYTPDRHTVTISNLRLTGVDAQDIDLSTVTVTTGIPGSNSGGKIAVEGSKIVITDGFCYDGHKITF